MFQYLLEQFFDYLFQYLVNCLAENNNEIKQTDLSSPKSLRTFSPSSSKSGLNSGQDSLIYDSHTVSKSLIEKTYPIQISFMDPMKKKLVNYDMTVKRSMKVEDVKKQLQGHLDGNVLFNANSFYLLIFIH